MSESLKKEKWNKLLSRVERFKHIPFVDFVIVAGSMAMDDIHKDSDFDLIIGTQSNRIFTVRMLSSFAFQIDGTRRKNSHTKKESRDKICLNHFVTTESYKLDSPYNKYWKDLYRKLVPVYGSKSKIKQFFESNSWTGDVDPDFNKWIGNEVSLFRKFLEFTFHGISGNIQEKIFKTYQIKRIERNLDKNLGYKPKVKYNDKEIRFHMDTKRIEKYLKDNNEKDN